MRTTTFILALWLGLSASSASALVIDTNDTWDGNINSGHQGSGQTLTVDLTENFFDDIGFFFAVTSFGLTFDFVISDALNGGVSLFSTAFTVGSGINAISIGQAFTAGSVIYAQIDYRGFSEQTVHFSFMGDYAGGQSTFGAIGSQGMGGFANFDHRFIANFSSVSVPEPGTLLLLGIGLAGMGLARRRKKV